MRDPGMNTSVRDADPGRDPVRNGTPRWKMLVCLQLLLLGYSLGSICSKKASGEAFLSPRFCLFYGLLIVILMLYAVGWQQIIKRMPLTSAFANRAVTVVWGIIWGRVIFHETITPGKIIGALLVVAGVVLFATSDAGRETS